MCVHGASLMVVVLVCLLACLHKCVYVCTTKWPIRMGSLQNMGLWLHRCVRISVYLYVRLTTLFYSIEQFLTWSYTVFFCRCIGLRSNKNCMCRFYFIFRVFTLKTRKYDAIDLSFSLLSRHAIWPILIVSFFFDDFISVYCALAHTFTYIHLSLFYSFSFIHSLFYSHLVRNVNIYTSNIHTNHICVQQLLQLHYLRNSNALGKSSSWLFKSTKCV